MEHEGSLLRLQEPVTCPYPEPDQSSPCPSYHILKIDLNIIFTSTPGSSKWSLSLRFPNQNPLCSSHLNDTCYMPRQSNSSRFNHPNNIWWRIPIIRPSLCSFLHSPVTSSLLGPNTVLGTLFSNTLSQCSSFNLSGHISHPHKTSDKVPILYILICQDE
jgi:hypothetical protein